MPRTRDTDPSIDPATSGSQTGGQPSAVYRARPPIAVEPTPPMPVPADTGRGRTHRWRVRGSPDPAPADLLARILSARGMSADDPSTLSFLDPRLTQLHDPGLIPGLDRAAERLLDAATASPAQPIVVYGDYDADGITASAILFHTLRAIAPVARVSTYVPHRIDEGYGLNPDAIARLASEGARVIVSVDCGITAVESAQRARAAGVDLIITDHHNPPASIDDLPDAFAVVHPRRPDSAYPFGDLCGAGVAYKLAWRLATLAARRRGATDGRAAADLRALLIELLALAALGAIADVVPLLGENRVMARFGLDRIKTSRLVGLRALVEASGLAGERVGTWDAGFRLAPRLNACGRMAHAREAVEMLTTADDRRAAEIADQLSRLNNERRAVERAIFEQAADAALRAGMGEPPPTARPAIVLADPSWHPGVVGIVCSRLVERFARPAILLREHEGLCHGSGRSIDGFNLHAALADCADLLTKFGGHDMAAGLTLDAARLPEFVDRFTAVARERIPNDHLAPLIEIDAPCSAADLTSDAVRRLDQMAPFGRGNPPVCVLLRGVIIESAPPPTPLGQGGRHLALCVRDRGPRTGRSLRLIAWNMGELLAPPSPITPGTAIDAVVRPRLSTYAGRTSVEPELVDFRPSSAMP